jgi:polysaccharide biosynthesis protein PelF
MSDVCLILEGTYPYTSGGVSTWIHQLISSMSDVSFSILHIAPYPNPRREFKYKLPGNVVDLEDLYLHDAAFPPTLSPRRRRQEAFDQLAVLHESLISGDWTAFKKILPLVRDPERGLTPADVFQSEESWAYLTSFYDRYADGVSFLDFFWSWRSIYLPMIRTLQCPLPHAKLYHTVSTGYAGLLACIAKSTHDSPVLLTEHGVYTHERLLEISQATWIYTPHQERFRVQRELSFFKRLWLGFFDMMGRLTYHHADKIVTLYDGNKLKQIRAGAPEEKISIIPNGIDVAAYSELPLKAQHSSEKTVAFIGRVVPIKDVKTFLHAAKIVRSERPGTKFLIIGPTDEEPEYTQECRALVRALGLGEAVVFTGKTEIREWYPKIDLLALTSLSEAQPYVLMEANAVGIPVVATDVGACREMLEGRLPDDKRIGASGLLTGVAHPEETAAAILRLLSEPQVWNSMSEAGRTRAMKLYDQNDLISRYLNLYERMMR